MRWTTVVLVTVLPLLASCTSQPEQAQAERSAKVRKLAAELAARREASAPKPEPPVVDVLRIGGASRRQVAKILGELPTCEDSKLGVDCRYPKAGIEVFYRRGKADWITIWASGMPFAPGAIARIGLQPTRPTFANENVLRWEHVQGFDEVSLFPGQGGRAFYFYVMKDSRQ